MSADKIDHKAETQRLTAFASEHDSVAAATSAVAHATLYAAEQQRIANIIAWTVGSGYTPSTAVIEQVNESLGLV